jgi:molybdopterin converting factor subunit 1
VKVLYFGQTRDATGSGEEEFTLPERASLQTLLERARSKHGKLGKFDKSMKVALNEEIAEGNEPLEDGDVIALIPPVAGG